MISPIVARNPSQIVFGTYVHIARSAAQGFVGIRRSFGFGSEHADVGPHGARRDGGAADQTAAADRRDDGIEIVYFVDQFARRGALAGDHTRIGEGMYERRAGFAGDVVGHFVASGQCRRADMNGRPERLDARNFHGDRAFRNHDVRSDAARARRKRNGRTMIAGRVCDNAACGHIVGQRPHRVARAAELERADALEIFALENDLTAGHIIDGRRRQYRRAVANFAMRAAARSISANVIDACMSGDCRSRIANAEVFFDVPITSRR